MSDAEGKTELVGLARSIDALFSSANASSPSLHETTEIAEAPFVGDALGAPTAEDSLGLADEAPPDLPAAGVFGLDESTDYEPPEQEWEQVGGEVPDDEVADGDPVTLDVTDEGSAEGPSTDDWTDEHPAAEDGLSGDDVAEGTAGEDAAGEDPADEDAADDLDEAEPGPIDLAVAAYLAGEIERAGEIRTLADELLEQKEIAPIVRAVERLTLAAGTPPDASVYAVVEPIISPIVLGRLVLRMGAARDEVRRAEYITICCVIGEPMAVAIRNDLAESTDRLARRIHFDALIQMGDASRNIIEEMAIDENRFLVRNAIAILGEIGGEGAVELVTSALAHPDARVRREALLSLAKLGDENVGQLVVGFLDDTDSDVRMAAAVAAGELKVDRALRRLISLLDGSKDPDQCLPLIRSLGQLGDPGAVVSIEKHAVPSLFSKPRADVRINAYRALNAIGTPRARKLLNQAISDKDVEVRAAVKDLLHMH